MKYKLKNEVRYPPITQIFINRGFQEENIVKYMNANAGDLISPLKLDNMREGACMLIRHLAAKDPVFIQVDPDADGFTSAAFLINYISAIFPSARNLITYRFQEGKEHGLFCDTIPEEAKLVIAPDSASNNIEVHKQLTERGVDVLVLDHHECDEISPYACIVNNQTCDYPNKTLSGVGIVFKFCWYIDTLLGGNIEYNRAEDFIDLAALGIISDMVNLTHIETRFIVKQGLEHIKNPFFKTMVEKNAYQLGEEVTPIGVAFYVAPYINATIRSGTAEQKELLFRSMLNEDAELLIPSTKRGCKGQTETIVTQAIRNCVNVKKHQDDAKKNEMAKIEETLLQDGDLINQKILFIQLQEKVDKNLVGLIANQLMGKYQKPVILMNRYEDIAEDGETSVRWSGSARNVARSALKNFREFVLDSGLAQYAEGHASAFGVSFTDEAALQFLNYANIKLQNIDFSPTYKVDFIFEGNAQIEQDILNIASLSSYWGQGFEECLIAIKNVKVTEKNLTLMSKDKNPTLKISLPNGVDLIKFKSSEEEYNSLLPEKGKALYITVVGTCAKNEWCGNINAQVLLEDYEINEIQYDF